MKYTWRKNPASLTLLWFKFTKSFQLINFLWPRWKCNISWRNSYKVAVEGFWYILLRYFTQSQDLPSRKCVRSLWNAKGQPRLMPSKFVLLVLCGKEIWVRVPGRSSVFSLTQRRWRVRVRRYECQMEVPGHCTKQKTLIALLSKGMDNSNSTKVLHIESCTSDSKFLEVHFTEGIEEHFRVHSTNLLTYLNKLQVRVEIESTELIQSSSKRHPHFKTLHQSRTLFFTLQQIQQFLFQIYLVRFIEFLLHFKYFLDQNESRPSSDLFQILFPTSNRKTLTLYHLRRLWNSSWLNKCLGLSKVCNNFF